jgi:16S rRNA (guanine966-N2)-methyltransferase
MRHYVRIIGGQYRGKKIPFIAHDELRPSPDRIRETVFNWLMHDIRGARCLDAFAGSGALGFEAFSRGAQSVTLLEKNPAIYQQLLSIALSFNSPKLTIKNKDACDYVNEKGPSFDIIFLDPPFAKNYLPLCIEGLLQSQLLAPEGLLYIESPQAMTLDEKHWQTLKLKRSGQVVYGLYQQLGA